MSIEPDYSGVSGMFLDRLKMLYGLEQALMRTHKK